MSIRDDVAAEIQAARAVGEHLAKVEPRAVHAEYDAERGVILVELQSGCWFGFPPHLGEGLDNATAEQLAAVEIEPGGEGLHWEELDADISVPGVIFNKLDAPAWWARWIASRTSAKKAAASRENGKKGGRPRNSSVPHAPVVREVRVAADRDIEDAG